MRSTQSALLLKSPPGNKTRADQKPAVLRQTRLRHAGWATAFSNCQEVCAQHRARHGRCDLECSKSPLASVAGGRRVGGASAILSGAGFSLISRCTHRAHAAFQLFEKIKLSFQSIIGATLNLCANILMLFCFLVTPGTVDGWADN